MSDREVKRNASQLHFGIITHTAPHFVCIHLILRNASVVYHQTNKSCILRVLFLFAFHLWSKIDANIICCVTDNLAWMVWSFWGVGGRMSENEMAPWSEGCGVPRLPYNAPKKNGLTFCPLTLTWASLSQIKTCATHAIWWQQRRNCQPRWCVLAAALCSTWIYKIWMKRKWNKIENN